MKKETQLGMNPSTASNRLVKDILFKLICDSGRNKCFHCGEEMDRDTYSIEHKVPWIDSDDPVKLYFDMDNISFSHLSCNSSKARRPKRGKINPVCGTLWAYSKGCRCLDCKAAKSKDNAKRVR